MEAGVSVSVPVTAASDEEQQRRHMLTARSLRVPPALNRGSEPGRGTSALDAKEAGRLVLLEAQSARHLNRPG
jgi:hypothetical protein